MLEHKLYSQYNILLIYLEKEVWLEVAEEEGLEPGPTPAIYLRFWRPNSGSTPGTGKTMEHRYSFIDSSFHGNWEIIYD